VVGLFSLLIFRYRTVAPISVNVKPERPSVKTVQHAVISNNRLESSE